MFNDSLKPVVKFCLFVLVALCLFPQPLYAKEKIINKMAYQESIRTDEDENPLYWPNLLYIDPATEELYVIDNKGRFIIYTADLFPIFTVSKEKGLARPLGLAVAPDGTIYVSNAGTKEIPRSKIVVINASLRFEREIYFSGFEGAETLVPYRLAIGKNNLIYVAGRSNAGMFVLNRDGVFLKMISPEEGGKPAQITNVNIDRDGRVYLTSMEEGRIYVYDEDLNFLFSFGEKGGGPGKLSRAAGVAVDRELNLMYVTDTMRHAVNVYNADGKYLYEFGGRGLTNNWFNYPQDQVVDQNGRLLVADTFNNRISVYSRGSEAIDSEELQSLGSGLRKGKISLAPPGKKYPVEGRLIDRFKDKTTKFRGKDMSDSASPEGLIVFFEKDEGILNSDIFKGRVQLNLPEKEALDRKRFLLISGITEYRLPVFHASSVARAGNTQ